MEIILGAAASVLVQILKNVFKTKEYGTLGVLLVVSFILSALYVWLQGVEMWETLKMVLVYSGAVYTFLIARFEPGSVIAKSM